MDLNQRQAAAALDVDRHVLIAAGAGTGKTKCVVARLLYLLGVPVAGQRLERERRLRLEDTAAITFTNAAAADLQKKLREALLEAGRTWEASQVDMARIGTIHGFCGQILWEFALQVQRSPGLTAVDEAASAALALEAAHDTLVDALEAQDVADLDILLSSLSVHAALQQVRRLISDADRLGQVAQDPDLDLRERAVVELARRSLALMHERLGQRQAIDFDSMVVLTRDLLRDRPDVRRVLQRRIRVLIVDEFQDVDPAQREIAWWLAEPEAQRTDTTRLMLVGDPKQSIFRFRRSDVTIWTDVQRRFESGAGAVHILDVNYRSQPAILAFADAVLGPVLDTPVDSGSGLADYEVPYQPLDPARADATDAAAVEIITLPALAQGKARAGKAARLVEVPAVADRIVELIGRGREPGDIAILLSAWAPAADFQAALAARGVGSWLLRNEHYYERREVLDCVVALRTILNPRDDLSLFGFLRSPMIGVRDETLLGIARQLHPPYWRHLESLDLPEAPLVAFAADIVRQCQALRDRVPPDELLRELLEATGYFTYLALLGDAGRQAEANVRKLLRLLYTWRDRTLAQILQTIATLRGQDEGAREGDAPLAARRDAVTITSIHSAKGLEWPVVIWADLSRGVVAPDAQFLVGRASLRMRAADAESPDADPRFGALRRQETSEEHAQRKRLWYVAATRAQEHLILSGVPRGMLTGHHRGTACEAIRRLGGLEDPTVTYRSYRGQVFTAEVRLAPEVNLPVSRPTAPIPVLSMDSLAPPWEPVPPPPVRTRHSASELVTFGRCQRKHWFGYVAGLAEPRAGQASAGSQNAMVRGGIIHTVLERLQDPGQVDAVLEDAIRSMDPGAPRPERNEGTEYRARLRGDIARITSHPQYRAVADLPGARREVAFVRLLGGGRVIEGKIDLLAERSDGLVLLDVKTGAADTENAAQRDAEAYQAQRDVYVEAVEAITGRPVAEFAFHYAAADAQVVTTVTPEVRAAGAARMEEAMTAIEAGARELTASQEECWRCGYRRVGWCDGVLGIA